MQKKKIKINLFYAGTHQSTELHGNIDNMRLGWGKEMNSKLLGDWTSTVLTTKEFIIKRSYLTVAIDL